MRRYPLSTVVLVAGMGIAAAEPARFEKGIVPSGPAKAAIEGWFTAGREISCTDRNGVDGPCDLGNVLDARTFYDATGTRAFTFVAYSPSVSNAVSLVVGQFSKSETGWTLTRNVRQVYGEGPDGLDFDGDKAFFTMAAMMPGDARCCLTGKQRYEVDLATGAVKAGPKVGKVAGKPAVKVAVDRANEDHVSPRPGDRPTGRPWDHNGSVVFADADTGVIAYDEPKASIRSVIRPGTVLFRGRLQPGKPIQGTAYAFKDGCPPAPYPVRGAYSNDMNSLTLRGAGPVRSGCEVVSYSERSPHATLQFSYLLND